MSLGRLGCYAGHGLGEICGDCQSPVVPFVSVDLLNNRWGFSGGLGAHWASPTNYDPTLHRRYGYGRVVSRNVTNTMQYQRPQPHGMGEIALGTSGWMLSDVASLALVV